MSKLWNGKKRKIVIYKKMTKEITKEFIADDAAASSPYNTFFLDGKKVYMYDERTHYYKSYEMEE